MVQTMVRNIHRSLLSPLKDHSCQSLIPGERKLTIDLQSSWIAPDGIVYAASSDSIYHSIDHGKTWSQPLNKWARSNEMYGVFVSREYHIYASPKGKFIPNADKGLWRSGDLGKTWSRVIDLSKIYNMICIWGIAEDHEGRIFAGTYGNLSRIYMSEDSGVTWKIVYEDARAENHIHNIQIDEKNGYVYACYGDYDHGIICSKDHGKTWEHILTSLPQMVGISITPHYRLFGTDGGGIKGKIYRTSDDRTAELVLDTDECIDNYWIRRDPLTGFLFAGFVDDGSARAQKAVIYGSTNEGANWTVMKEMPIKSTWDGTYFASNIMDSQLFYSFNFNGTIQKGRSLNLDKIAQGK